MFSPLFFMPPIVIIIVIITIIIYVIIVTALINRSIIFIISLIVDPCIGCKMVIMPITVNHSDVFKQLIFGCRFHV